MLPSTALLLLAVGYASAYCPDIFKNQTDCSCDDYIDGAVIRCSGQEGPRIVDELKKSHFEIRELALEHANIVELGPNAFKNLRIKKLILDKNHIRAMHKDTFKGLENVLMELSIASNHLPEVPTNALAGLRALRVIVLKCNKIGNLTKPLFKNTSALIDVDLSCNKICSISSDAFSGIRGTLQNLILDSNCMTEFPSEAVKNMDSLIAFHLNYNKLSELPEGALTNMTTLSMLSLNGNNISTIRGGAAVNSNNIHYLYLGSNNIRNLDGGVMSQFRQVQVLDLSYNFFEEVTVDYFAGLDSLQHINLESNAIRTVAPKAFEGKPLLLLWLPNNCLTEVNPQMFIGAPFLRQISFANNNIRVIQAQSAGHLANLHHFDLSFNKILTLPVGALSGPDHLTARLQENPMVCGQDGFHVITGSEYVNLTTEANLICKTRWQEETEDVCPKATPRPIAPACCSQRQTPITLAPTTPSTTTTTTETPTTTTTFSEAIESMKSGEKSEEKNVEKEEAGEEDDEDEGEDDEETTTTTTTPKPTTVKNKVRKINMDRFLRLQNAQNVRHAKPHHKPSRYMAQESEEKEEKEEEETTDDIADDGGDNEEEEEEVEDEEEETTTTTTAAPSTISSRRIPARVRDRQRHMNLPPWMNRGKPAKPMSAPVEEDFNKDDESETVQVDRPATH